MHLIFEIQDKPGALVAVLKVFADANINLTRISSKPTREELGKYVFLFEFDAETPDLSGVCKVRDDLDITYFDEFQVN